MSAGKGSTPRPMSVDKEEFSRRWERTFAGPSGPESRSSANLDQSPQPQSSRELGSVSDPPEPSGGAK